MQRNAPAESVCRSCVRRFFHERRDFDKERMLHRDSDLQRVLPSLVASNNNASRAAATGDGYAFPPYTVTERCEPLKTWRGRRRAQSELLSLVEGLAQLLAALHASGRVPQGPEACLCVVRAAELAVATDRPGPCHRRRCATERLAS